MPSGNRITAVLVDEGWRKGIERFKEDVTSVAREIVNDSAIKVQARAKQNCPVDTGRLRSSLLIMFFNNGIAAEIGSRVTYAPFVEYGTGRSGARTNRHELPEGYQHGQRNGMPARAFLWPALESERPSFAKRMRDAGFVKVRV